MSTIQTFFNKCLYRKYQRTPFIIFLILNLQNKSVAAVLSDWKDIVLFLNTHFSNNMTCRTLYLLRLCLLKTFLQVSGTNKPVQYMFTFLSSNDGRTFLLIGQFCARPLLHGTDIIFFNCQL